MDKKKEKEKEKEDNIFNFNNINYLNDIIKDSKVQYDLDNTFTAFTSVDNIFYIIYTDKNNSIIGFNLIENKIIIKIKNAHKNIITNFRHFLDKIKKRDLIISLSFKGNIKVWNINNCTCILNLEFFMNEKVLYSACFLRKKRKIYIINGLDSRIIVNDLNGYTKKEISTKHSEINFIDSYYDKHLFKYYIITGNIGYCISYDFETDKKYHIYDDENDYSYRKSIIIIEDDIILKLIESSWFGNIRIWNFRTGELLNIIKLTYEHLYGFCLWNKNYLMIGSADKNIKIIDLKNKEKVYNLKGHNDYILTLKKINLPKYGECLLSQGYLNGNIKLWNFK